MSSQQTKSFAEAYQTLKNISDKIRDTEIDDIDELLKIVETGAESFKICKHRLQLADQRLKEILDDPEISVPDKNTLSNDEEPVEIPF